MTLQDLRIKAKKQKAAINKYTKVAGGGPPAEEDFDKDDLKIIDMVSDECVTGHTTSCGSAVEFVS